MNKVLNYIFLVLKLLLLIASFIITFYIIMSMYNRLDKNIIDCIPTMLPFVLLLILFTFNLVLGHKNVNNNIFYNIACCMAFSVIVFAAYRTFFDTNMVMITKLGYNINFNYFADVIAPMKAMLYLLSLANIFLIISGEKEKKDNQVNEIARKVS